MLDGGTIALAKIVIVGTSNSVMGEKGFVRSLSIEHDVVNLSSGRVPFYCHIKTIELNKELIEGCDLLIIDHYINDLNFYTRKFGEQYNRECEYFYQLLSTINTNIINLLFPIKNLIDKSALNYYRRVKQLTKKYNISIVDLNEYDFKAYHYDNPVHISHKISYILGLSLSKLADKFQGSKPCGGRLISSPFKVFNAKSLAKFAPDSEIKTFSNSLLEIDYLKVNRQFSIPNLTGMALKSIGYLTPKGMDSQSGVIVNNKQEFSLLVGGYFHESFDREIVVEDELTFAPMRGCHQNIPSLMQRAKISGNFNFLFIADILLSTGTQIQYKPAQRIGKTVYLPDLEPMLDSILVDTETILTHLSSTSLNALRDAAILLENIDLDKSYELMLLVQKERPQSKFIKNKLALYRQKLDTDFST